MPIDYMILDEGSFVYARGRGALTGDEVAAHERALMADPRVKRGFRQLLDLRWVAEDSVGEELLDRLSVIHTEARAKISGARYALVAHGAHWFRLGNAYRCEQYGMTWIVFNCPSTACIWLGTDYTDIMEVWGLELPLPKRVMEVPVLAAVA